MKILLIRPDMDAIQITVPPLGLLTLAGYIREYTDHAVSIIDCRYEKQSQDVLSRQIAEQKPDLVGLTGFTLEKSVVFETAKSVKKLFPNVPVVTGGPLTTADPQGMLENEWIDYVVMGEGEVVFRTFIDRFVEIGEKADYDDISSFGYKPNGKTVINYNREFLDDLDSVPMAAWDLIDVEKYFRHKNRASMNLHNKSDRALQIFTSRGCPYQCTYCHNVFGKKVRKRSVDHVLNEIRYLHRELKADEIEVLDDIFNVDKERCKAIFNGVIHDGMKIGFSFPNGLRADVMDGELLDKMKEAGVYRIMYAVEAGSPRIQKLMKKNLDLEKAKRIIEYTAKKRISVGSFFMMGFLDETEEEVQMTIDFACDSRLHTASFLIVQPYPNTEIFNQAVEQGFIPPDRTEDAGHFYRVTHNISKVPTERLEELKTIATRRFWFNPYRIFDFVRCTPIRNRFWKKLWITLQFFILGNPEKDKPVW